MTIQKRLARSNVAMFFLPVLAEAAVFAAGFGVVTIGLFIGLLALWWEKKLRGTNGKL